MSSGRLDRIVHADGGTTEICYDAGGRRSSTLEHDGTLTTYRWNELDRLTEIVRSTADGQSWRLAIDHDGFGMLRRVDTDQHGAVALLGDAAIVAVALGQPAIATANGTRRAGRRCRVRAAALTRQGAMP